MTNEAAKIVGSVKIEERVVLPRTMAQKRGVSNTREVTKKEGKATKI